MIPDEQKEVLLAAAEASVVAERQSLYEQEEEGKQQAIEDGAEINEIDRAPFIDIATPLNEKQHKIWGLRTC
ncbi:hypothetical protein ACFFHM_17140 [Halalkalibacter kiskunsagensis]|uniref:Uncharacterized protein n=1 Tax=Halalkalibacter kiskunsagensis TaxID=1548599 RepID=A0ABV6KFS8_9BACI